ncbi:glycoside hydrolase family 43 protein [Enterococcus timonensis]|uniref:glycoside hydrolase family 43 protein n=1 Tax=Enterococcus timonensis TaxID=1852364 RepID=UPI0008D95454|nr:glycoside hydrolase family 43 protein [Enterococcus timonensis]
MFPVKIKNPILPGFNPDPNILKVGDIFYIAVSSFEWLPGVRVYTSKDLINWQHETDILTTQVNLLGNPENASIWAPQISFSNNQFYCLYTDVKSTHRPFKDCHNYLITAPDINGPWSDPVYLNSSGFDPSLFHAPNGKKYLLNELWDYRMTTGNKSCGIVLQEYDEKTQELIGEVHKIFDGTSLAKTEASHLYVHDDFYYLITAEGGTGRDHSVTVARSKNIFGPYEVDPESLLTARDKPASPLQCSGHASLVEHLGHWYIAYLTTRPLLGKAAILGRETAIQEVVWQDGWLRLADGTNGPAEITEIFAEKEIIQEKNTDFHDDFSERLKKEWNTLRQMPGAWADLSSRPGYLRLESGESLQSLFDQHLLAIRQKDFVFSAATNVTFEAQTFNQMAGLTLYLNDQNYLFTYLTFDEEKGQVLRLMQCVEGEFTLFPEIIPLASDSICLKVNVDGPCGKFYFRETAKENWQQIGPVFDLLFLAGGFTGNFVGITVIDMDKKAGCSADFDFFEYHGKD